MDRIIQICGASMGIAMFNIAAVTSLIEGGLPASAIARGLVWMLIGYAVGACVGFGARVIVREHNEAYAASHPIPDHETFEASTGEAVGGADVPDAGDDGAVPAGRIEDSARAA